MKSVRSNTSRLLSLSQAILFLLAPAMPVNAAVSDTSALSFAEISSLGDCEKSLFGTEHKNLPSDKRVEALENQVFGETKSGALKNRVAALKMAMNAGKTNLLMPPEAAKMDTSAAAKPPAASTPVAQSPNDDDDMPAPAPKADPAKNMLHQAMSLYSQGRVTDAEAAFKKVLLIDKHNADAYYNLGAIAEGRSDFPGALNYYQNALKENPADGDTQSAVAAMQAKLGGGSRTASQPPVGGGASGNLSRDALRAQVSQASAAYKRGDFDQAIQLLQGVARQAPQEADVQFALSQAYKGKQQYMDARSALNQAISISPDNQMYKDALRDLDRQIAGGGARGGGANPPQGYDTIASTSGSQSTPDPNGGVLPFSNSSANGWQPMGNNGTTAAYTPSSQYYPGDRGSTSSRIKRAAIRGAAGAAVGMAFGSMFGGYNRRSSMMTGAAIGGLFGALRGF
jgi:tetratricopeptide (TPR) repeat protein